MKTRSDSTYVTRNAARDPIRSMLVDVGFRVRELRERRGLSQQRLAELTLSDRQTINRLENNRYMSSVVLLLAVAVALDVHPADLLGGRSPESPTTVTSRDGRGPA